MHIGKRILVSYTCALLVACIINMRISNEKTDFYLIPYSVPLAITAPTIILPVAVCYGNAFDKALISQNASVESSVQRGLVEGGGLGSILVASFYVPFFVTKPKRKSQ